MLLVLCSDTEIKPGPNDQDVLTTILSELKGIKAAEKKQDDVLSKMNSKLSELDEVLKLSKANEEKIRALEESVKLLEKTITSQERRLRDYEDRVRRNNLIVFGTREMLEDMVVCKVFNDRLGLSINSVEAGAANLVQFLSKLYNYNEKISAFKKYFKVKDTGVSVSHDFSQATLRA